MNIATCDGPHARSGSSCASADSARCTASAAASTSTHVSSAVSRVPSSGTTRRIFDSSGASPPSRPSGQSASTSSTRRPAESVQREIREEQAPLPAGKLRSRHARRPPLPRACRTAGPESDLDLGQCRANIFPSPDPYKGDVMAKQITCECGYIANGETDDEVVETIRGHMRTDHPALLGTVSQDDLLGWIEEPRRKRTMAATTFDAQAYKDTTKQQWRGRRRGVAPLGARARGVARPGDRTHARPGRRRRRRSRARHRRRRGWPDAHHGAAGRPGRRGARH